MRETLNYIIEANISLLLFFVFYRFVLVRETDFKAQRMYLLFSIFISLTAPLLQLQTSDQLEIPSVSQVVPSYWLPEVSIAEDTSQKSTAATLDSWTIIGGIYIGGVVAFGVWLAMQLGYVCIMLRKHVNYSINRLRVIESSEDKPSFSFFNMIYIGRAHTLSAAEKEHIIRHESEHARKLHSFDILLVTLLGVAFWFNPLVRWYKRTFIQLHEFEADAHAVKNNDVNQYCSLLARSALQGHFPIASHFNESLTLKRIEMMKTVKSKLSKWKISAAIIVIGVSTIIMACQDQIAEEVANSTVSQSGDYPQEVKSKMDAYLKEHPDAKLTYMVGDASEIDEFMQNADIKSRTIHMYSFNKDGAAQKGVLLTNILQFSNQLQTNDKVFMVVEKMPEYPGGFDAMRNFIQDNLRIPTSAKDVKGTTYVSMVIDESGKTSDVRVLKGIHPACDAEAVRVVSMFPAWTPGQQNGTNVKVRFTLPIKFDDESQMAGQPTPVLNSMNTDSFRKISADGKTMVSGRVVTNSGKPLAGVNVVVSGTTTGTTTDSDGRFSLTAPSNSGKLFFSFVGFDSFEKSF